MLLHYCHLTVLVTSCKVHCSYFPHQSGSSENILLLIHFPTVHYVLVVPRVTPFRLHHAFPLTSISSAVHKNVLHHFFFPTHITKSSQLSQPYPVSNRVFFLLSPDPIQYVLPISNDSPARNTLPLRF